MNVEGSNPFARSIFSRQANRFPSLLRSGQQHERLAPAEVIVERLRRTGARRAVVCGGDTSTHVARALGIEALEFIAPVAPGGPLCRVHAPGRVSNGCEIVFKGGQVGRDFFFLDLVNGDAK